MEPRIGVWMALCALVCACARQREHPSSTEAPPGATGVAKHAHPHDHSVFHSHAADGQKACTCAAARQRNGWCAACQVGYVAAVRIKSADLFDAIDAHGHEFKPESIECGWCQGAIAKSGFCDSCGLGFANGQLYCSHLSYTLARGRSCDPESITCTNCRGNSTSSGWCSGCETGMVGNVAFSDRAGFDAAVVEYQRLQIALGKLAECESCAVVMFTRGDCPIHGLPLP